MKYVLAILCLSSVGLLLIVLTNRDLSDWIKWRIFHRDYLHWKANGGQKTPEFIELLMQDRSRDSMILGKTEPEVLAMYPFLVPMSAFGSNTYKRAFLMNGTYGDGYNVYWFDSKDGADWAVIFREGVGYKLLFVKG